MQSKANLKNDTGKKRIRCTANTKATGSKSNTKSKSKKFNAKKLPRGKQRIRPITNRLNYGGKNNKDGISKKQKLHAKVDCNILRTEGMREPSRTEWPEYRYYQINEHWQRNACTQMGLNFVQNFKCQPGGNDIVLTRPDLRTLRNVNDDGNCYSEQCHL